MKLYRKKLNSLEELKREKIRLRYQRRQTNANDLNPLAEMGRSKVSGSAKTGMLGTIMELAGSKSQLQTAMAIGKPLLKMLRKRHAKKQEIRYAAGLSGKQSGIKKIIIEVAITYLIGKAAQMGLRGFKQYVRRRKLKKALHR